MSLAVDSNVLHMNIVILTANYTMTCILKSTIDKSYWILQAVRLPIERQGKGNKGKIN